MARSMVLGRGSSKTSTTLAPIGTTSRERVALACGSRSTTRVRRPRLRAAPARPSTTVVLPTPPLRLRTLRTNTGDKLACPGSPRNAALSARSPSGGGGARMPVGGAMRGDQAAVGKDLACVLEHQDAVAEQAPTLLGVERDGVGRHRVGGVRGGATGSVH